LEKALNTAKVRHSNLVSTDVVYYQLAGLEDFESRARLREEIRRKVARIDVTFGVEIIVAGASEVNGVRPGTGRTMVRVRFVNGVERVLLFQEKDVVLLWLGEAQAIRPAVTREEAKRFWNIRPLVNTPTKGTKNFGVSKPSKLKKTETTSSIAKSSTPVKKAESAKSTPEENFTKLIELHKTRGPVPFRPTQRDYKRQEKLVSVDSLSKITFDDGLFKDEADLNGFVRWILRCQTKRQAVKLEP
jgi:hypothetical protein